MTDPSFSDKTQELLNAFQDFAVDVVYDRRKKGIRVKLFSFFLLALSQLFTSIVKLRLFLYQKRIAHNQHLGCQVIVVGNLTVGGTGKTPIVEKLARHLSEQGRKVGILSRGYKSKKEPLYAKWWRLLTHKEEAPPRVVSDGENVLMDSETAGDEPYMLAKNLPGVCVVVDKDRVKAGHYAIKKFGVDTIILDDGFQYFKLKDHIQVLLIDKSNPFGNKHLLPRGILREPVSHMSRATYVFLTKSNGVPNPDLEEEIRLYKPDAEIIECTHSPKYLKEVNALGRMELNELKGKRVAAMSAIAVPESFENFLLDNGAEIVLRKRFLDHHRFSENELERVFIEALSAGAEIVLTTEKDAVRIPDYLQFKLPFYFLRIEIEILNGVKDFEAAVNRICFNRENETLIDPPFIQNLQAQKPLSFNNP